MRPLPLALALFVLAMTSAPATVAQPTQPRLLAVVHAQNKIDSIDRGTMRNIYLGQTTFWANNTRIRPYNRVHDGATGKAFFRDVLGMTPGRYRHTWQKQQLSGRGVEPPINATPADVVASVGASTGAIGYLLESEAAAADARVRLIPIR
jgi:ABC-type phosphate transport system substrate-binding protein